MSLMDISRPIVMGKTAVGNKTALRNANIGKVFVIFDSSNFRESSPLMTGIIFTSAEAGPSNSLYGFIFTYFSHNHGLLTKCQYRLMKACGTLLGQSPCQG